MNFKTFMVFSAALACTSLWAVVTTGNMLCRIAVESETKDTIISLPLVDVGGLGDSISITNMVLTENLSDGDTLMAKIDEKWQTWMLQNGIWGGATTVSGDETISSSPNAAFERGTAIILRRTGSLTKPIYLYGEFRNEAKEQAPVSGGWTLMGNALPSDFPINKEGFWTAEGSPSKGDKLIVPVVKGLGVKEYTWGTLGEGENTKTGWIVAEFNMENGVLVSEKVLTQDSIPAGQGFWYQSVGESVPTVDWNKLNIEGNTNDE